MGDEVLADELATAVAGIVGGGAVRWDDDSLRARSLLGLEPRLVVKPDDEEELARLLEELSAAGAAVVPWGSGTKMERCGRLHRMDVVVDTSRFRRVVDYDHENLSITVGAGCTLGEVRRLLSERGQFLPIEPFWGEGVTVGGVVASNADSPLRYKYGSIRDMVLGLRAVLPAVGRVGFGGKVTKNVAGYDMSKILIGSWGTLGVITEVTFRVHPLPEAERTVVVPIEGPGAAGGVLDAMQSPRFQPSALELLGPEAAGHVLRGAGLDAASGWRVAVRFDGIEEAVAAQVERFCGAFSPSVPLGGARGEGEPEVLEGEVQKEFWRAVSTLPQALGGEATLKVVVPKGMVVSAVEAVLSTTGRCGLGAAVYSRLGSGIVWAELFPPSAPGAAGVVGSCIEELRVWAEERGGFVLVERTSALEAASSRPRGWRLMKRIKEVFDPACIMSPGRMPFG